jgi:biopolymer transport protein ExbD
MNHQSLKALLADETGVAEQPPLHLEPAGQVVYDEVMAAMQNAEELGGPEGMDYVALMANIIREAIIRARTFMANYQSEVKGG